MSIIQANPKKKKYVVAQENFSNEVDTAVLRKRLERILGRKIVSEKQVRRLLGQMEDLKTRGLIKWVNLNLK